MIRCSLSNVNGVSSSSIRLNRLHQVNAMLLQLKTPQTHDPQHDAGRQTPADSFHRRILKESDPYGEFMTRALNPDTSGATAVTQPDPGVCVCLCVCVCVCEMFFCSKDTGLHV